MWVARAAAETSACAASGLRTWFGTLTMRPDVHEVHEQLAFQEWAGTQPGASVSKANWDALKAEERWPFVRYQALHEVQKYWKRLRKAGHKFRYFVVFEPHQSGRVHMHWLLHEAGSQPILYKDLQAAWGLGHAKTVLVGGRSKRSGPPRKAAFYVAKYLSKSWQSRQLASVRYGTATARPCAGVSPALERSQHSLMIIKRKKTLGTQSCIPHDHPGGNTQKLLEVSKGTGLQAEEEVGG